MSNATDRARRDITHMGRGLIWAYLFAFAMFSSVTVLVSGLLGGDIWRAFDGLGYLGVSTGAFILNRTVAQDERS